MKKLLLILALLIFPLYSSGQISSHTANAVYGNGISPGSCNYNANADPIINYQGTMYICSTGNAFVAISGGGSGTGFPLSTTGHVTSTGTLVVDNLGTFTLSSGSILNATALQAGFSIGSLDTGTPTLTWSTNKITASQPFYNTNSVLTTPNLGTPSALVGTNIIGTAAGLNIGGNAATASALASLPTLCATGQAPTGILANGNSTGCAPAGEAGIGGGTAGAVGLDGVASITNFGAVSATTVSDAAMVTHTFTQSNTSTGTVTAPGGTTTINNDVVLYVYFPTSTFTPPGGLTSWFTYTNTAVMYQTISTAGAYAAVSGSQSPTNYPYAAMAVPLVPVSGQTISTVSYSTATGGPGPFSVTAPAGVSAGQFELGCILNSDGNNAGYPYITGDWAPVGFTHISTKVYLSCWSHIVASSEPTSYTFNIPAAAQYGGYGLIAALNNVGGIDNQLTSATASFSSINLGQRICLRGDTVFYVGDACSKIGYVSNSTTLYPPFANVTGSSLTSQYLVFGADSSGVPQAAANALPNGAGEVYVPTGTYFCTAPCLTVGYQKTINFEGAGAAITRTLGSGISKATPVYAPSGSAFLVIASPSGAPAVVYSPSTVSGASDLSSVNLMSDIALLGTGGAGDGIDTNRIQQNFDRVVVEGFNGNGIEITCTNGAGGLAYVGSIEISNSMLGNNTKNGLRITGSSCTYPTEGITVRNNEIYNSGGPDLSIDGTGLTASTFDTNLIQYGETGITSSCEEIYDVVANNGVSFRSNWIENDNGHCDGIYDNTALQGPKLDSNIFQAYAAINLGGTTGVTFAGNNLYGSTLLFDSGSTYKNATIDATNQNGGASALTKSFTGTSGTASCNANSLGGLLTVACYLNGYAETGSAQTWALPIGFVTTPLNSTAQTSCGSYNPSATSTTLTMPANAGMTTETCQFTLTGQTN
jgi:hypothetical protein